jgi:hypothetical protein
MNLGGYKVINNSFDGVDTLPIPTSGTVSSCSCENCGLGKDKYQQYNLGKRCNSCNPETPYVFDPNLTKVRESNDPLGCQNGNFACYSNVGFAQSIQPNLYENKMNVQLLNQNFGLGVAPDFYVIPKTYCGGEGVSTNNDARVIDSRRSIKTELDRVPYDGQIKIYELNKIYDKQYQGYGQQYNNYRDVDAGQIQYYYDKSIADPYFQPVYTIRSDVLSYLYKDPMDSVKPYYARRPTQQTLKNLSKDQMTRDTLSFREDLMSLQSGLMNRKNWTARWESPAYNQEGKETKNKYL